MAQLPECCQASVRCSVSKVTSVEDACLLRVAPDVTAILAHVQPRNNSEIDREWLKHAYERPPKQYKDMMKVSCVTIYDAGLADNTLVREALHAQAGQLDYAVAALCVWLTTQAGKYVCSELPLHTVLLEKWPDVVKPFASECRRLGQIFGRGPSELQLAFQLRRLVSLAGRTNDDADWEKELTERTALTTAKRGFKDGLVSSAAYRYIRQRTLAEVAAIVVRKVKGSAGSFSEFFERRWWESPRGTTSRGGDLKRQLKDSGVPEFDLQMRPVKPIAMENWTLPQLTDALNVPPASIARGSTKPEPGLKKRALLAVDDLTAFVAGYASHKVEGSTKHEGMVLQQTPADVAEWVNFDAGPPVWRVSNDYTNFNILHSLKSMQMVDLALAAEFDKINDSWARSKSAACRWVAASYNRAFVTTPMGVRQIKCGLWSGHRNTARDNTILHLVYLRAVLSVQRSLFGDAASCGKQRICGDDETISYDHWGPAVCHTLVADALGFESQVSKGLLSRRHDEFLQLMRMPGRVPQYPVANTILTFCSGNWYKDPVRNLDTTVKDVSDHLWDMVLGGVPIVVARRLGLQVLNYLMQVQGDNGLVTLEWQDRRNVMPGGHPLWGMIEELQVHDPIKVDLPKIQVPMHATTDGSKREDKVWEALGGHRRDQILNERAWSSYRNVAKNWLQHKYDEKALEKWPRRTSRMECLHDRVWTPVMPSSRWRIGTKRDRLASARAAAVACGLPPELLGTDDMFKAMQALRPRDHSQLLLYWADRQQPTTTWRWWLPPLLRAV